MTNLGNRATKVYDVKDNTLVYGIILGGTYSSIQSYPHVRIQGLMRLSKSHLRRKSCKELWVNGP